MNSNSNQIYLDIVHSNLNQDTVDSVTDKTYLELVKLFAVFFIINAVAFMLYSVAVSSPDLLSNIKPGNFWKYYFANVAPFFFNASLICVAARVIGNLVHTIDNFYTAKLKTHHAN